MFCGYGFGGFPWFRGWHSGFGMLVTLIVLGLLVVWAARTFRGGFSSPRLGPACPACKKDVDPDYFRCPHCGQGLKGHCPACSRVVDKTWQFCPYCSQDLQTGSADIQPQPKESAP